MIMQQEIFKMLGKNLEIKKRLYLNNKLQFEKFRMHGNATKIKKLLSFTKIFLILN